ncbi:MAG: MgtC/SapB family protein [Bacteroidetes bacterium]|nr:MgtC/SapB family protein [Bacteroidota bacterium]MBS1629427.1 MgtC/SapB family protein [Bacteroidota bacterium]
MLSWSEILIRLLLASAFGAFIGIERERKNWTAGLRTHMLVCIGSCLIMMISSFGFSDILGQEHVVLDPSRVAAQVISGIGFIGAGTILFIRPGTIHGLTTAAGLWTVAAIGLATGGGMYFAAAITTLISLIILWALKPLETIYLGKGKQKSLQILVKSEKEHQVVLKTVLEQPEVKIQSFSLEKNDQGYRLILKFDNIENTVITGLSLLLNNNPHVTEFSWD